MTAIQLLHVLDYAGVAVFAISGALAAGRRSMDWLGVMVIAIVTSIGGGTLRDLLLDRTAFWIRDPGYLMTILGAALFTMVYARFQRAPEKALAIADAFGLALFSISGAQIAESAHHPGLIVVVMGTITGVFGGVIRDVLCAEIPMILRKGSIYGTAVIVGASIYVLLQQAGIDRSLASLAGMTAIATLRLSAIYFNLTLPVFTVRERP